MSITRAKLLTAGCVLRSTNEPIETSALDRTSRPFVANLATNSH
jgi:hypothetical protein